MIRRSDGKQAMSEGWAPGLFFIGLLALVADSCDSRHSAYHSSSQVLAQPELPAPAPTEWDERSDCEPGTPPNSLANAIDVLRAHCDRARAVTIVASVAGLALGVRGGGGALARGAATRAALADGGTAGVALDEAALSEQAAARLGSQAYRLGQANARSSEDGSSASEAGAPEGGAQDSEGADKMDSELESYRPIDESIDASKEWEVGSG